MENVLIKTNWRLNSMYNTHHNKHNNEWKENKYSEGGGHSLWRTLLWNAEHVLEKTVTTNWQKFYGTLHVIIFKTGMF